MQLTCRQVSLHLSHPDVVMQPNVAEIKKAIARLALAIAESAKHFVRWMDGTCLEAAAIPGGGLPACISHGACSMPAARVSCYTSIPAIWQACLMTSAGRLKKSLDAQEREVYVQLMARHAGLAPVGASEDDEPFVHSFYLDACASPELRRAVLALAQGVQHALAALAGPVEAWRRHQALWKSNKAVALEKVKVPGRPLSCCMPDNCLRPMPHYPLTAALDPDGAVYPRRFVSHLLAKEGKHMCLPGILSGVLQNGLGMVATLVPRLDCTA